MADDPYKVLGVARGASDADIRQAYRRLAKEYHPDVNPGETAAEAFQKISAAYALVGDTEKRGAFDRGEIDASGERRGYQNAYGGGFNPHAAGPASHGHAGFGDIFSDLFGGGAGPGRGQAYAIRGQDVRYTLEVDFVEAVEGAKKRVTLPEGGVLDLSVPAGVADGQTLRLKGKGASGLRGGDQGDALVEIKVRPHAEFKRLGDDILFDLPVTIDEALLGAKIAVPTVSGTVQLSIPTATNSGTVLRLKGKGVINARKNRTGDQLVTIRIVMPPAIDDELIQFMTKWRDANPYNPGRKT